MTKMLTTVEMIPRSVVEYCKEETLPAGSVDTNILSTTMFILERLVDSMKGKAYLKVSTVFGRRNFPLKEINLLAYLKQRKTTKALPRIVARM